MSVYAYFKNNKEMENRYVINAKFLLNQFTSIKVFLLGDVTSFIPYVSFLSFVLYETLAK